MMALVDLLSSAFTPVQTMILPYLEVADIIALTRTSKDFDQLQPILKSTAYNVNRFLKRFFSDPVAFRSVQAECGALLSGGAVRNFLQRSKHVAGEVSIFVSKNQEGSIISYLETDNYVRKKRQGSIPHFRKTGANGQTVWIHLFAHSRAAIAQMFEQFPVTASMNFLSWNKSYALFPHTTFIKSECYLLKEMTNDVANKLSDITPEGLKTMSISWAQRETKERQNSYECLEILQDKDADDIGELFRRRRVGDRHTWVMNLDTRRVSVPNVPTAVLESTTFRLCIPHKFDQQWSVTNYDMDYDTSIRHPVLRYEYVTLREDTRDEDDRVAYGDDQQRLRTSYYSQKCQELSNRLDELTMIELTKIAPSERPAQHEELEVDISNAASTREQFDLPATWTFYDDKVIAYLDKAWKVQQKIDEQEEAIRKARFGNAVEEYIAK